MSDLSANWRDQSMSASSSPSERSKLHEECLRSLSYKTMTTTRSGNVDKKAAAASSSTCTWIFQNDTYKDWASGHRSLLWIKGKPGSGKSTLLQRVTEHVGERRGLVEGALILSFYFHGRCGEGIHRTSLGFFRSLLYQLQEGPDAPQGLLASYEEKKRKFGEHGEQWEWELGELRPAFVKALQKVLQTHPVYLFIDALDEAGPDEAGWLAEELEVILQEPTTPAGMQSKELRVVSTCRQCLSITLESTYSITLEDHNTEAISSFVQHNLSSILDPSTTMNVTHLIVERANGVFLWARLAVDRIRKSVLEGTAHSEIEQEVSNIPETLDQVYMELLNTMDLESRKLIRWVSFAMEPLSIDEIRAAMEFTTDYQRLSKPSGGDGGAMALDCEEPGDRMKTRIQALSHGLIEVADEHAGSVQFIHQSVQDFFVGKNGLPELMDIDPDGETNQDLLEGKAHYMLCKSCIGYLNAWKALIDESGKYINDIEASAEVVTFPLLRYATLYWVPHVRKSEQQGYRQDDLLGNLSDQLVRYWAILAFRSSWYWHWRDVPIGGSCLLHVAAQFNLTGPLQDTLSKKGHEVAKSRRLRSWEQIFRTGGGDADIDGAAWEDRMTPLLLAASHGHENAVRLLLTHGAKVNLENGDGKTPLLAAVEYGHLGVARLLLEIGGANPNLANFRFGRTPLALAAERGDLELTKLLVSRGAKINLQTFRSTTPLLEAAARGHVEVVRFLLDKGADADPAGHMEAVRNLLLNPKRSTKLARLLLQDCYHGRGSTPLGKAAEGLHLEVVRLLLEKGAKLDRVDPCFIPPLLSLAASRRDEALLRMLPRERE
ncbi:uncharacterized protein J7T54_001553 [Emericellopsis cladophorae]|uniref:Nephrocystin 3-like N-terminal domain-containing protein n=1 Tax=Emericellopsis cladophorae TaxID=2686198 RepID=A0A9P9XUA2_9HYPO|nr:uncharacterized protein J7T54_001553 [Emericellopsis cladophorae]KAI6777896.1 hypothetical protein J7T54_001553 [Emericellopsis cladophorae]